MGLYFRKSVNLGGGVRLNFSKSGVGISAGVKGARISKGPRGTYANFSIPGTGIGYRTKLSSSNAAPSTNRYPYVRTITNEYTGRSRTIRAATQWELNSLVQAEQIRMQAEEMRQREIKRVNDQREQAAVMTKQLLDEREEIRNILNYTLNIDDRLDWSKQYMTNSYHEFVFDETVPEKHTSKSSGLFGIFKKNISEDDYDERMAAYENRKREALSKYLSDKEIFENRKREHNAEIEYLKENFENSEKSAVEKYTSIILSNSHYPSGIDMDFDVEYHRYDKTMIVSFLMPPKSLFPPVKKYIYSKAAGTVLPQAMSESVRDELYEHMLYSICIRTMHEIYEAVYTNAIDRIVFNAYLLREVVETAVSDDFTDNVRCIFSVSSEKEEFLELKLDSENVNYIIKYLGISKADDFDSEEIQPITK